ncbi:hypothetical protein BGW80DRAFT_655796 [Lactifluus volemus]|nr:hypothetical protein BGW80DRAFT_655796 [Lactifluus volemus]
MYVIPSSTRASPQPPSCKHPPSLMPPVLLAVRSPNLRPARSRFHLSYRRLRDTAMFV